MGRFLGVDVLAGDYPAWSSYHYVLGNPVLLIDPSGKEVEDDFYRNEDGILVAVERNDESTDRFYTIDEDNNVTLDVERDNTDEGFDKLTDERKNMVINLIAEDEGKAAHNKRNKNGVHPSKQKEVETLLEKSNVAKALITNTEVISSDPILGPPIGAYGHPSKGVIYVFENQKSKPGGGPVVSTGSLPKPIKGETLPLPSNSLAPNITKTVMGSMDKVVTKKITDKYGNLIKNN